MTYFISDVDYTDGFLSWKAFIFPYCETQSFYCNRRSPENYYTILHIVTHKYRDRQRTD